MDDEHVAVAAAVATVALAGARAGIGVVGERFAGAMTARAASDAGWFPAVGSVGETVLVVTQLVEALAALVTTAIAVGLGVALGRRVDVGRVHRRLNRAVAAGSGAVVGLAGVAALVGVGLGPAALLYALATVVRLGAALTLPLVVGTLAGAALVAFEADGGDAGSSGATAGGTRESTAEAPRAPEEAGRT